MTLSRNEFRKAISTEDGRRRLGIDLTDAQASRILADDALTDSWHRKITAPEPAAELLVRQAPEASKSEEVQHSWGALADVGTRIGEIVSPLRRTMNRVSRRQLVIAVSALVVIAIVAVSGAVITSFVKERQVSEQARIDAQRQEDLEAASDARAAEAKRKAEEEKRDREQAALNNAPGKIDEANAAIEASPWGEPTALATLNGIRDKLVAAVEAKDASNAWLYSTQLPGAITNLGTYEESRDRVFVETLAAQDRSFYSASSKQQAITDARAWCSKTSGGWVAAENSPERSVAIEFLRSSDAYDAAAIVAYCPDLAGPDAEVDAYLADGDYRVGGDGIAPGTYLTTPNQSDCYWERHTLNGDILDNDFITAAPNGVSVTVRDGEGFSVSGCGLWKKVA